MNKFGQSEAKKKREFFSIEIRKKLNREIFAKNRKRIKNGSKSKTHLYDKDLLGKFKLVEIELRNAILANDKEKAFKPLNYLRMVFSKSNDPNELPFKELFDTKIFDEIVSLCRKKFMQDNELVSETFWWYKKVYL